MCEVLLQEALSRYPVTVTNTELIRHNENATYKINTKDGCYVLRIHQPAEGFTLGIFDHQGHARDLRDAEMQFLQAIRANTDIGVQAPVRNQQDDLVTVLSNGVCATMLEWIEGETVEKYCITEQLLFDIGAMTAKLHRFSLDWGKDHKLYRYCLDSALLEKLVGKVKADSSNGWIGDKHARLIEAVVQKIDAITCELAQTADGWGLGHMDLSKSNLIVSHGRVVPIDFSLSGYGALYMDLGCLYGHFDKVAEQKIIRQGYESVSGSPVEAKYIEPFFILGIVLYISTHIHAVWREEWFSNALNRWEKTFFDPFIAGDVLVLGKTEE